LPPRRRSARRARRRNPRRFHGLRPRADEGQLGAERASSPPALDPRSAGREQTGHHPLQPWRTWLRACRRRRHPGPSRRLEPAAVGAGEEGLQRSFCGVCPAARQRAV
jgi:hypothetical protein